MKRVLLQPAYILHRRSYRETSFLLELFTPEYGRVSVIAKGARQSKSISAGLLQAFMPLLVSWVGNGELMTLTQVDCKKHQDMPQGECLFAGFYLNELLIRLLQKWDAHPKLYAQYEKVLHILASTSLQQQTLRSFEKILLEELGYAFLPKEGEVQAAIFSAHDYYRFVPEEGFVPSELDAQSQANVPVFSGKSLLAIAREDWHSEEVLQDAKRLMRFILMPLLGTNPIYSRKLFMLPGE